MFSTSEYEYWTADLAEVRPDLVRTPGFIFYRVKPAAGEAFQAMKSKKILAKILFWQIKLHTFEEENIWGNDSN